MVSPKITVITLTKAYGNYVGNAPVVKVIYYLKDIKTENALLTAVNIVKMTDNDRLCHLCAYCSPNSPIVRYTNSNSIIWHDKNYWFSRGHYF